jgi:hypothetical protein
LVVIYAAPNGSNVVLTMDIRDDAVAYIDADWIPRSRRGPVAALLVEAGSVRWDGEPPFAVPAGLDAEQAAEAVLTAVARDASDAAQDFRGQRVEVTGRGFIARRIRAMLGLGPERRTASPARPSAIIETTGEPECIVAATRRLVDMGTLVLVGELRDRVDLDLYPDVHVRGLQIVGVAPPLARGAPWNRSEAAVLAEGGTFERAQPVAAKAPLPTGASWYCVAPVRRSRA